MSIRSSLAALMLVLAGAVPAPAAYSFLTRAENAPGPFSDAANSTYFGPNNVFGTINFTSPPGVYGVGTPLNSGQSFTQTSFGVVSYGVGDNGGSLSLPASGGSLFAGIVTGANVGPQGGTFRVLGYLRDDVSRFFGVPEQTLMEGIVSLGLRDSGRPGNGNKVGTLSFTFGPSSIPEPSSVLATASGLIIALGYAGARRRRKAA